MSRVQRGRRVIVDEGATPDASDARETTQPEEMNDYENDNDDIQGEGAAADQQLVKKLVRYALSCEHSRTPIRRDGIKERVLGNQGRAFKRIFAQAQEQLRDVFGMELRELPVRDKISVQEKRQAMKSNSQPKSGSGTYILLSTLPIPYRDAIIIPPSKAPSAEDEAAYVGFYTMVVSLIMLSGGELSDRKLKRHLLRLNADKNVLNEKTEVTLKKMEKNGYVIRKVDQPANGQDTEPVTTWHVGQRAREEIGVEGVMGFAKEVYGGSDPDLEAKLKASLGVKEPAITQEAAEGSRSRPRSRGVSS